MKCKKCGFEFTEGIFCPECGTKNNPNEEIEKITVEAVDDEEEEIVDIDKALEDVLFYYEQSRQKHEAMKDGNHLYYNRAQHLLQRMIKQKSSDYRVWWEACKPIDFWEVTFSEKMFKKYEINDTYFSRALDYANIDEKKRIIVERDSYQERKRKVLNEINKARAEKKAAEERIAVEKAKEAQKQAEEQRKVDEIQRRKQEEEHKERERIELERQKEAERIKQDQRDQIKLENEGKVMAAISLIFGIISLCTLGMFVLPEILGIVFAFLGKKQGIMRGTAKAGLLCSVISIVLLVVFFALIL